MDSDAFKEHSHASQKMSAFFNRCIQGSVAKESLVSSEADKVRRLERRMSNSPTLRLSSASSVVSALSPTATSGRLSAFFAPPLRTHSDDTRRDDQLVSDDDLANETPRRRTGLLSSSLKS
jgi:hypothetical protein